MIHLYESVSAWNTKEFEEVFKCEVGQLDMDQLPLQQALSHSSYACDKDLKVLVINASAGQESIQVRAGIFYTGILPGCACTDDPAPDNEYTEYCEVLFSIDLQTALSTVSLLTD